eukprot:scaffold51884_cov28-Phaeocystis_antarctica.AAC.1
MAAAPLSPWPPKLPPYNPAPTTLTQRSSAAATSGVGAGCLFSLSRLGFAVRFKSPAHRYVAFAQGAPAGVCLCEAVACSIPSATSSRKAMRSVSVCGRCAASKYNGCTPIVSATAIALPSGLPQMWPSPWLSGIAELTRIAVPDFATFRVSADMAHRRCPLSSMVSFRALTCPLFQLVSEIARTSESRSATSRRYAFPAPGAPSPFTLWYPSIASARHGPWSVPSRYRVGRGGGGGCLTAPASDICASAALRPPASGASAARRGLHLACGCLAAGACAGALAFVGLQSSASVT